MSGNSGTDQATDKSHTETNVQTVPQNLTTIQNLQSVQNIQSSGPNIQSIQTGQTISGQTATIVGKSISLELNPKLLMKPANIGASSDNSKITNTFCTVPGSTVRIIAPNIMNIERQGQAQTGQQTQQIVTSIPSTYHVPRGPAAVANISTPRATIATPLVKAIPQTIARPGNPTTSDGVRGPAVIHTSARFNAIDFSKPRAINKTRVNSTVANTAQWQQKTSVVYATPHRIESGPRHTVPVVSRSGVRPTIYTTSSQQQPTSQAQGQSQTQSQTTQQTQSQTQVQSQQQQPRLMSPSQVTMGRPIQATVVTATPSRLVTPVLQAPSRLPTPPTRPATPQVVTNLSQTAQAGRPVSQTIQQNQTSRTITGPAINRIAVAASVIGTQNRVAVTSVQASGGRQLTINTAAGSATGTVSRIIVPQASQQQQQGTQRVVQAVATPLANFSQVSRVIATTSTNVVTGTVTRVAQTGPTSVARITGMSLHPLPLTQTRPTAASLKVTTQVPSTLQAVQLKQAPVTIQHQSQTQGQSSQQVSGQQVHSQGTTIIPRALTSVSTAGVVATSAASTQPQSGGQVQTQYLHGPPHSTTYYSIEPSGTYPQYRPASVQPVRLLVDQGYEEPLSKPNASPRPSILRKRDTESSPIKTSIAKNLVPVLSSIPSSSSASSPPNSPKCDRDHSGNQSSGSTTVSATSSPGLDEEPEQSRIPMNTTVEMSPRKKPRKQQLTGVELTESRCHDAEMQFITEEKIKKDIKEEPKDVKYERKPNLNIQHEIKKPQQATPPKPKPTASILSGIAYKTKWNGRSQHYKRPSDVKPREERRPSLTEISQQKFVLQKVNGWKVHHLTAQMEDLAELEKAAYEKLKATLTMLESQQNRLRLDENLEKVNELIKGNLQRSNLVSEGIKEASEQLVAIFDHKNYVADLLQRCSNKRTQKKR